MGHVGDVIAPGLFKALSAGYVRQDADTTKRKEAAAKLEEMTKTWGSRFYGQTYAKDIVTSYLGNPDFTEEQFEKLLTKLYNLKSICPDDNEINEQIEFVKSLIVKLH
jgi:hypothetical protein